MSISRFLGQRWFQIFGIGVLLFFGSGFNQVYIAYIGYAVVGAISLTLLIMRLRNARRSTPRTV